MRIAKTFLEGVEPNVKDHFTNTLAARGIEVKQFMPDTIAAQMEDGRSVDDIAAELLNFDLVVHDKDEFKAGNQGISNYFREQHELANALRRNPIACFQINPNSQNDITRKDNLARDLSALGVLVPSTVMASDYYGEFSPAFLKHRGEASGNNSYFFNHPMELLTMEIPYNLTEYVVVEAFEPPTPFASNFRFVTYGPNVLGGIIYFNKGHSTHVNGKDGAQGIPIIPEPKHRLNTFEAGILDVYDLDDTLPKIIKYVSIVGGACQEHGYPAAAVEFVMDRETRDIGLIDINAIFGLGIFHVLYDNERAVTPENELVKIAGEKLALAYLGEEIVSQ